MGRVIVVQYITLDGVVEDPDGSDGTSFGGWAMRHGPEGVAGDKFRLGSILETGVLLLGRRTWDHFSTLWPRRDTPFARAMNRAEKAVVTGRTLPSDGWSNSHVIPERLTIWAADVARERDIVVIGSDSVIRELRAADLIDEYRLITFPIVIGEGRQLFRDATQLELVSSELMGPASLSVFGATRP